MALLNHNHSLILPEISTWIDHLDIHELILEDIRFLFFYKTTYSTITLVAPKPVFRHIFSPRNLSALEQCL